ncbi:ribonuclease D [Halothiobacillus sp. DCM-1]|uniref:ribonuclease D n=1 Tax=Halothiobacillus sp. DCM-1 TaxID=3112558 RepID=UPI00324D5205
MIAPHPIQTPEALSPVLAECDAAPFIALDTEFRREDTYVPELCLVQLATPNGLWLVDALATDLTPLWHRLNHTTTPVVLHAAQQDLELIAQASGSLPRVLRDTQIAAAFLGLGDQIGYAQLVAARLHLTLDKSQSRTDWTQRPLSEAQRRYAADDVRYLQALYPGLLEALESMNRRRWFEEECAALSDARRFAPQTTGLWRKVSGQQTLKPAERAVLEAITTWREQQAIDRNLPRRWVLADETALKLATTPKPSPDDIIAGRRGVARPSEPSIQALLEAMRRARQSPPESWPRNPITRLSPAEQSLLQRWQSRIQAVATQLQLSPALLATTDDLLRWLRHPEQANRLTQGWRAEVLDPALQFSTST